MSDIKTIAVGHAVEPAKKAEIPSLIIPIAKRNILLPTVSVAEMLPFVKPQLRRTDLPPWFLGAVQWRGVSVPMFSYERLNGEEPLAIKPTSQMAILNSTGVSAEYPFVCFPTQGIPRLSRVAPDAIKQDIQSSTLAFDQMNVLVNDELVSIPDVSKIEQALIDLLHE
ncbi:chemotaxis protein CheW [Eionea flava]